MAGNISFGTKSFRLSPGMAQVCRHFDSVTFRNIKPDLKVAEAILGAFNALASFNPDQNLAERIKFDIPHQLASVDAIFNPPVPGHKINLEISHNNVTLPDGTIRNEILAMRWSTFTDFYTERNTTLGIAFVLTGEIELLLN